MPDSASSYTWSAPAGRSRNASARARTKPASTTTKSAPGAHGSATSVSPCSLTPSSASSRSDPEKVATPPKVKSEERETPPRRRRLARLSVAEIRRLLHLDRNDVEALIHGLRWSIFRRSHQAGARRAHVRRHLALQTLMI